MTRECNRDCSKIFVTWIWAAVFLSGLIITVATLAWEGSERFTVSDSRLTALEQDVQKMKRIDDKLDTLLVRVRELKHK